MKCCMVSIRRAASVLVLGLLFLSLSGCLQKIPHEMRSPCVALPAEHMLPGQALQQNPLWNTPCNRRPVNTWWQNRVVS